MWDSTITLKVGIFYNIKKWASTITIKVGIFYNIKKLASTITIRSVHLLYIKSGYLL